MIKASHNTFSYAKPIQWYLRPFAFMAKCQNKSLAEQVKNDIKVFDMRLRKDENGEWIIAHNAFIYIKGINMITYILDWLDKQASLLGSSIYVRILHEVRNKKQEKYSDSIEFDEICNTFHERYTNLKFFGGQRTMDWQQDHIFPKENEIDYIEMHASVRWHKWFHWWPWLYAYLHNKSNDSAYKDKDVVVYQDFV